MAKRVASKTEQKTPEQFLPLTPAVFHILVALGDGEAHGYAIMQDVLAKTGGSVRLSAGTLYGQSAGFWMTVLLKNWKSGRIQQWMTRDGDITVSAIWEAACSTRNRTG